MTKKENLSHDSSVQENTHGKPSEQEPKRRQFTQLNIKGQLVERKKPFVRRIQEILRGE